MRRKEGREVVSLAEWPGRRFGLTAVYGGVTSLLCISNRRSKCHYGSGCRSPSSCTFSCRHLCPGCPTGWSSKSSTPERLRFPWVLTPEEVPKPVSKKLKDNLNSLLLREKTDRSSLTRFLNCLVM